MSSWGFFFEVDIPFKQNRDFFLKIWSVKCLTLVKESLYSQNVIFNSLSDVLIVNTNYIAIGVFSIFNDFAILITWFYFLLLFLSRYYVSVCFYDHAIM